MKILKSLATALVATMLCVTAFAQSAADVNTRFNEAAELINAKKFAEAIPVLQQVVEIGIEIPEALESVQQAQGLIPTCYFQGGLALAQAGDMTAAAEQVAKALETAELYGNARIMANSRTLLGRLYGAMGGEAYNAGDFAKAIDIYTKALAASPKDTQTMLLLAAAYDKNSQSDKAVEFYEQVIATGQPDEDVATARQQIANYQLIAINDAVTAQDWAEVIELGETAAAAQTTPEMASEVYFRLGAAYQNTENKTKAIETFRKVTAGGNVAAARALIAELSK